eukprot:3209580-Amphidinium_carterae.1
MSDMVRNRMFLGDLRRLSICRFQNLVTIPSGQILLQFDSGSIRLVGRIGLAWFDLDPLRVLILRLGGACMTISFWRTCGRDLDVGVGMAIAWNNR